jgi:hypothetical protein
MKKLTYKIFLSAFILGCSFACRDEDAVRVPEFLNAPNLRIQLDATENFFNLEVLPDARLVYDVYSENYTEIQEVEISVRFQKNGSVACNQGGCVGPFVVKTYTAADLAANNGAILDETITIAELLTLTGLTPSDIGGGDNFFFVNKTTMTDGRIYPSATVSGQDNVPGIYDTPGASFTASFAGIVACPFVIADAVGTYTIVADNFGIRPNPPPTTVVVEAGTAPNTFIMRNVFGHGFDLTATVSTPASGALTIATTQSYVPTNTAPPLPASYGSGFAASPVANGSYAFSCVGQINLRLTYSVSIGTFTGLWDYKLLKQ